MKVLEAKVNNTGIKNGGGGNFSTSLLKGTVKYSQLLVRTAQSNSWAARRRELGDLTSMDTNAGTKRPPNPKEPDAFNMEGEEERWTNPKRRRADVCGRKTTGAREVL